MPRADGSGSMAPMSEASVAFHCSPGNRGCALSLHLFWQRSSFSESTEQVSTGLGGVWKWGSGGGMETRVVTWNVDLDGNQEFPKCRLSHSEGAGAAGLQLQCP